MKARAGLYWPYDKVHYPRGGSVIEFSVPTTRLIWVSFLTRGPVSRKSRKATRETANRLFWKADLLICFQGNKKKNKSEVWRLKSSPFLRYKGNCDTRKWPLKFRDFRETVPRAHINGRLGATEPSVWELRADAFALNTLHNTTWNHQIWGFHHNVSIRKGKEH